MKESNDELIGRLLSERERTRQFFQELTPDQWGQVIYAEAPQWTAREILAHLFSAETEFLRLFRSIVDGGMGVPVDFMADEFNASEQQKLNALSTGELMDGFLRARQEMLDWVTTLSAQDLEKTGIHPVLGRLALWEMIKSLTLHAHLHVRDIRRKLESGA